MLQIKNELFFVFYFIVSQYRFVFMLNVHQLECALLSLLTVWLTASLQNMKKEGILTFEIK